RFAVERPLHGEPDCLSGAATGDSTAAPHRHLPPGRPTGGWAFAPGADAGTPHSQSLLISPLGVVIRAGRGRVPAGAVCRGTATLSGAGAGALSAHGGQSALPRSCGGGPDRAWDPATGQGGLGLRRRRRGHRGRSAADSRAVPQRTTRAVAPRGAADARSGKRGRDGVFGCSGGGSTGDHGGAGGRLGGGVSAPPSLPTAERRGCGARAATGRLVSLSPLSVSHGVADPFGHGAAARAAPADRRAERSGVRRAGGRDCPGIGRPFRRGGRLRAGGGVSATGGGAGHSPACQSRGRCAAQAKPGAAPNLAGYARARPARTRPATRLGGAAHRHPGLGGSRSRTNLLARTHLVPAGGEPGAAVSRPVWPVGVFLYASRSAGGARAGRTTPAGRAEPARSRPADGSPPCAGQHLAPLWGV